MVYSGVLLVDKPSGPGSRDVDRQIARHLGVSKVGHVGTLDPLASGLLILLVGQGTKLSQFLVGARKRYQAVVELGRTTDTYDVEGRETSTADWHDVTADRISTILNRYRGRFDQTPPPFSAIKVDGVANYKRARRGEEVELTPRTVEIAELNVLNLQLPRITLDVRCSKGTYMRSLANDIGQDLGCGGVLAEIRRVESEPFHLMHATALRDILAASPEAAARLVIPLSEALSHLPVIKATAALDARLDVGNLPQTRDLGPIHDLDFREGDLLVIAGSRRIGIFKAETDSHNLRHHPRPLSYLRVIDRDDLER